MEEIRHQLIPVDSLSHCPIIPLFTGFYTSKTVVLWDFFHQHVACELLFLPCYIPGKSKSSWHFSFQESASGSSCSESFVSRGHRSLVTCMNSNKHPKCSIYGIFSLQLASIYGKCRYLNIPYMGAYGGQWDIAFNYSSDSGRFLRAGLWGDPEIQGRWTVPPRLPSVREPPESDHGSWQFPGVLSVTKRWKNA